MILNKIEQILSSDECENFSIAFLLYAICLFFLSLIFYPADDYPEIPVIEASINETEKIIYTNPIEILESVVLETDNTSYSQINISNEIEDSSLTIDSIADAPSLLLSETSTDKFNTDIFSDRTSGVSSTIGKGFSSQSSASGALDRLTPEIIANAENKDLIVIWLFDASISLNHQRQQIYNRFDRILSEVDVSFHKRSIKHSICSFGRDIKVITSIPTKNAEELKKNISEITIDESGIENTFNAINYVCKKYSKLNSRLMIIVFTDEVGDDIDMLDKVSSFVRSIGGMVYVVGSPSPFGKSATQFKFVEFDPQYQNSERWVEVQQGPETLFDMTLNIHSLPIDNETLDSGFGPFALSKLCHDTGGIFFSVHPNRKDSKNNKKDISPLSSYISYFFNSTTMQMYSPDYRSVISQSKDLSHITKQSLIKACTIRLNIAGEQTLRFKAFNEGMFAEELGMAQRFSARLEPKINEVYNILLTGEPSYQTLKDKRWIASYCLAMGRILATKCRLESYNLILAEAKSGIKKKDPKTNIWTLVPSKNFVSSNSILRKNHQSSIKYLQYIADNFPDTPWALIANEELNTPIGYTWVEHYEEPPKLDANGGENNQPKDDNLKPKLIPKPLRKIDKI